MAKLTLNEIKHLKWTVLVTALALTLFTASLFSVVCVYIDLTDNILNYFDTLNEPLSIYAKNVNIRKVGLHKSNGIFRGEVKGVTDRDAVIYANGKQFEMRQEFDVEWENGYKFHYLTVHASQAVYVTDEYAEREFQNLGVFPNAQRVNSVSIHRFVANRLQVDKGDSVTIDGKAYVVVGIYGDEEMDKLEIYSSVWAFTAFVDENTVFSYVDIKTETSRQTYDLLLALQRNKVDADYSGGFKTYINNLFIVNAFLIAVAITIFIVNILILYATISVILNNRMAYVCRLKTLGATDTLITAMYYVIVFVLLAVICAGAFFLSKLMVVNIMDACQQAFNAAFTTRVNFGVTAIYFGVVAVLLGVLCYLSVKKINNKAIVAATRSD